MELRCAKTGRTSYDDESIGEIHFACGHVEHLCFDARREWSHFISNHPLANELEQIDAQLFILSCQLKRGKDVGPEYLETLKKKQGKEMAMFKLASEWLDA